MDQDQPAAAPPQPKLEPEDYYMEGEYTVFTAAYHLRRGYCCNSGCRHCPYGFHQDDEANTSTAS
jgi:Family of unknown function (DUF5522)